MLLNQIHTEHFAILIYIAISAALSLVVFGLSYYIMGNSSLEVEKVSAYECGFDPFDDARSRFDIRFYLVSILFIIFDLEVSFLFPWAVVLGQFSITGSIAAYWPMFIFLLLLTIGFAYEWMSGALDWE